MYSVRPWGTIMLRGLAKQRDAESSLLYHNMSSDENHTPSRFYDAPYYRRPSPHHNALDGEPYPSSMNSTNIHSSYAVVTPYDIGANQHASSAVANGFENFDTPYPFLTLAKLRADLQWEIPTTEKELHELVTQVCDSSDELWHIPTNVHEFRSGLRYYIADDCTGKVELANEWERIFALHPEYLQSAPPEVQQHFNSAQRIARRKKHPSTSNSLTEWVLKRNEEDAQLWDASIAERNARCGWDPKTDLSPAGLAKLAAQPLSVDVLSSLPSPLPVASGEDSGVSKLKRKSDAEVDTARPRKPMRLPQQVLTQSTRSPIQAPQPIIHGLRLGLRPTQGASAWLYYEWSTGRKRVWLELTHRGEPLPMDAVGDYWNNLTSHCTSEHVDIRLLGDLHLTAVELIVVSHLLAIRSPQCRVTNSRAVLP
tara:strand:+ start:597 stop:1871 length:1275 start_codon:yes stop_codon:yes gene_type:complete